MDGADRGRTLARELKLSPVELLVPPDMVTDLANLEGTNADSMNWYVVRQARALSVARVGVKFVTG